MWYLVPPLDFPAFLFPRAYILRTMATMTYRRLGRVLRAATTAATTAAEMITPASHRRRRRATSSPPRIVPPPLGRLFLLRTAVAGCGAGGAGPGTVSHYSSAATDAGTGAAGGGGVAGEEDGCPPPGLLPLPRRALEFYIDGNWVPPAAASGPAGRAATTLEVVDPSLGLTISRISMGTAPDVDRAVRAAGVALPSWSALSIPQRRRYVERLLRIYRRRREEMARLISAEMGSPIDAARGAQAGLGMYNVRNFLHASEYFEQERLVPGRRHAEGSSSDDNTTVIRYEPIGVVALITPWNWPMNQVTLKVIPALLVGCTCVLKPSEIAPLSSLLFAEMIHEADFPPGVFNLINGDGDEVGYRLCSHDDVDMVSFTGSTKAGRLVSQAAASSNLKKVSLELGGKGANLIFDDVGDDLEDVVRAGVRDCFDNTGQNCNAPTRMLVERGSYDEAVRIATEAARDDAGATTLVGSAHAEGDHLGPVASRAQYECVQGYIRSGINEGARLVAGGLGRPPGSDPRGNFVRPTVFADVLPAMTIAREEIFGPVLCISPFVTEEEAVEIANGTPYGLTNYVRTSDGERRERLAHALKSGMIEMNGARSDPGAPFAAVRASGNGREGGVWGLEEYTVIKVISGLG